MVDIPMPNDTPDGAEYLIQQIATLKAENEQLTFANNTITLAAKIAAERTEAAERALAERAGGVKVDDLAQEIRRVNGSNSLGAGALAEALIPFLSALTTEPAAPQEAEAVGSKRVRDAERIVRSFAEDRLKSTTQWALDPRYLITLCDAVRSRPAEQAVTEATGEWREVETNFQLKGRRRSPAYFPATGEICEVSGPNCDDANGFTWGGTTVLWQNEIFVLYGNKGYWPVLHKHEHVLFRPAALKAAMEAGRHE